MPKWLVITSYVRLPALLISAASSNREQEELCTPDLNRLRTFESQQDTAMRTTMKSRALEREREREEGRRDNGKEGKRKVKEGEGNLLLLLLFWPNGQDWKWQN